MNRALRTVVAALIVLGLAASLAPTSASASASASVAGQNWSYVALGDSLGVGIGGWVGYVPRYAYTTWLDTGNTVSLNNLSQNGWTSGDLLAALKGDESFRSAIRGAKVITWDIGGNDLNGARTAYKWWSCGGADNQDCLRATTATFKANWAAIIAEILALRSAGTIIRTMDIYNPYVRQDQAADTWRNDGGRTDLQVFKGYLDEINAHIATTTAARGIPYAKVYQAFNGASGLEDPRAKGYLWIDGLHPSDKGHKAIADGFRSLGYTPTP